MAVESIGLSRTNATFWKRGSAPSSKNLQKLADFFGVPVDYLLGKDDSVTKDSDTIIAKAETESDQLFLTRLLREIDELPEPFKTEAIHQLAATARLVLNSYERLSRHQSTIKDSYDIT